MLTTSRTTILITTTTTNTIIITTTIVPITSTSAGISLPLRSLHDEGNAAFCRTLLAQREGACRRHQPSPPMTSGWTGLLINQ